MVSDMGGLLHGSESVDGILQADTPRALLANSGQEFGEHGLHGEELVPLVDQSAWALFAEEEMGVAMIIAVGRATGADQVQGIVVVRSRPVSGEIEECHSALGKAEVDLEIVGAGESVSMSGGSPKEPMGEVNLAEGDVLGSGVGNQPVVHAQQSRFPELAGGPGLFQGVNAGRETPWVGGHDGGSREGREEFGGGDFRLIEEGRERGLADLGRDQGMTAAGRDFDIAQAGEGSRIGRLSFGFEVEFDLDHSQRRRGAEEEPVDIAYRGSR